MAMVSTTPRAFHWLMVSVLLQCPQVKMEASLKPELLDGLDRKIKQLESEAGTLSRAASRKDRVAANCLEDVQVALELAKAQRTVVSGQLDAEKAKLAGLNKLRWACRRGGGG